MIMKKINDRIYEFWNLDYIDDPKLEHPEDVDVLLEKEFPMSVEAFFFILKRAKPFFSNTKLNKPIPSRVLN